MSIIELIGFIITMGALMILSIKRSAEEKNPKLAAKRKKEQDEALKDLLRSMNIPVEEDEVEEDVEQERAPLSPLVSREAEGRMQARRTVNANFHLHTAIERRKQVSQIEKRRFVSAIEKRDNKRKITSIVSNDFTATATPKVSTEKYRSPIYYFRSTPSHKALVVLHEIYSPPLALRRTMRE